MIQATTNTNITVLLKHVFFFSFIRTHHNILFVFDLLDHQPHYGSISHSIF
jgi:hypothetical protein